jgi:hypothetical protein
MDKKILIGLAVVVGIGAIWYFSKPKQESTSAFNVNKSKGFVKKIAFKDLPKGSTAIPTMTATDSPIYMTPSGEIVSIIFDGRSPMSAASGKTNMMMCSCGLFASSASDCDRICASKLVK